jgi:uncharacterized membrane protein YfcA
LDLDSIGLIVVAFCAVLVGISKTGIPGVGVLIVPLMALVIPARKSTGLLLGILILADVFAIIYHRRNAKWGHVLSLLPPAFAGIVAGYFGLRIVDDQQLKPIIGGIVLVMLGISYWRKRIRGEDISIPTEWWFAVGLGFIAMRLPKVEFVGTSAWFFFIVNWLKVPFSANLNLMTVDSVKLNLMMLPCILVGAVVGIFFLRRIPQKVFNAVVQILAVAAAIKLLF